LRSRLIKMAVQQEFDMVVSDSIHLGQSFLPKQMKRFLLVLSP